MSTTISYTVRTTIPPVSANSMGGYELNLSVVAVNQIPPKIFVYQRAPVSDGAVDYAGFFYTVSSVADLYSVPEDNPSTDDGFYRTDSVSLVFGSMENLNLSLSNIKQAISELCIANDAFMNLSGIQLVAFPPAASNVYIGTVESPTDQPDDTKLLSMSASQASSVFNTYSLTSIIDGSSVCIAVPTVIGSIVVEINGSPQVFNSITRDVVGPTGLTQSYTILVTQNTFSGSLNIIISPA